jgi:hypothetical protein
MSAIKHMIAEQEDVERAAFKVLTEAQVLRECDGHEGLYFSGGADMTDAYRLANHRITNGLLDLPAGITRREFTDAILKLYNENSIWDSCNWCYDNLAD